MLLLSNQALSVPLNGWMQLKQESIPVGCVPPTSVAVGGGGGVEGRVCFLQSGGGVLPGGVCFRGGVCPGGVRLGGVCLKGMSAQEGCLSRGVSSRRCLSGGVGCLPGGENITLLQLRCGW